MYDKIKRRFFNALPDLTLLGAIVSTLLFGKFFENTRILPEAASLSLGAVCMIAGIVYGSMVLTYIIRQDGSTDVTKTSDVLITKKYFSASRNPLYLAELVTVTGAALFTGTLMGFVGPLLYFAVISLFVIPYEEQNLTQRFGKQYQNYKRSTRRWM